jgi:hypothetical protein
MCSVVCRLLILSLLEICKFGADDLTDMQDCGLT